MKKHYFFLFLVLFFAVVLKANIITVTVSNFQFSPANIPNVVVGDIIRFEFTQGFHNATSNDVPGGLPAGSAAINSGAPSGVNPRTYDYTVTTVGEYKYICEAHADAVSFTGMVGTFTASAALPATLKSFNMITAANKKPLFSWSTLTEENVSHFSLRCSYDGFKYNEVGNVKATGNSQSERSYSYADNAVPAKYKYIYYMLATVDKDGKEKLSKVIVFKNPVAVKALITQIGPNPIKRPGQLMVQFNSEKAGKMITRVIDANGKIAYQANMAAFPGLNNGHIHVCDLNAGTYTVQFTLDGIKENKKIVVY